LWCFAVAGCLVRDNDTARALGVRPKQQRHIAYALHERRRCPGGEGSQSEIARLALSNARFDFDEFVVGQRAVHFCDHRIGEAGVAERDDGV